MVIVVIILIILLTLAYFYLKCSLIGSLSVLFCAVFSLILTFSYYEWLAEMFITRGYGGQWPLAGCFAVIFIACFSVFRGVANLVVGDNIDFGQTPKKVAAVVCGLFTGLLFSGVALVVIGLMPVQHSLLYSRFAPDKPIVLSSPSKPLLNPDGFVTGLYGWVSRGTLASKQSFAVVQADYLTKNHLNRYQIGNDIGFIASREALTLPPRNKKPVRLWPVQDQADLTVVRVGISMRQIPDGGAGDGVGVRFSSAQFRLICKPDGEADTLRGSGEAIWPVGMLKYRNSKRPQDGKEFFKLVLGEIVSHEDTLGTRDGLLWLDMAFEVPGGRVPVALQFKQNAMVSLVGITPTASTPEIELGLDTKDEQEEPTP